MASILAIIGWIATNYKKADDFLIILAGLAVPILFVALYFLYKKINKQLKIIRDI